MRSREESGGFPIFWPGGVRHGWRREPDLRLSYGTGEGMSGYCHLAFWGWREGVSQAAQTVRDRVPILGVLADRLVVVMKAVVMAVERRGRVVRGLFV